MIQDNDGKDQLDGEKCTQGTTSNDCDSSQAISINKIIYAPHEKTPADLMRRYDRKLLFLATPDLSFRR
jgi:hypothetical protein